jgi:hypothetical protein
MRSARSFEGEVRTLAMCSGCLRVVADQPSADVIRIYNQREADCKAEDAER